MESPHHVCCDSSDDCYDVGSDDGSDDDGSDDDDEDGHVNE